MKVPRTASTKCHCYMYMAKYATKHHDTRHDTRGRCYRKRYASHFACIYCIVFLPNHLDNLVLTETISRPSLTMVLPVALHDSLMWLTIHIDANNTWSTWPNII